LRFEASPGKQFTRPYLEKTHHKKGLVEWLKVLTLSSNPRTIKKKKKKSRKGSRRVREREREREREM
jgi:hypothetical protein